MSVRDTSVMAYIGINADGSAATRRAEVYMCIQSNFMLTRQEIARRTGIPINVVCGRCRELLDAGLIRETGQIKCSVTGKMAYGLAAEIVDLNGTMQRPEKKNNLHALIHTILKHYEQAGDVFGNKGLVKHHLPVTDNELERLKKLTNYGGKR